MLLGGLTSDARCVTGGSQASRDHGVVHTVAFGPMLLEPVAQAVHTRSTVALGVLPTNVLLPHVFQVVHCRLLLPVLNMPDGQAKQE